MSLYIKEKPPVINKKKFNTESVVVVLFCVLCEKWISV